MKRICQNCRKQLTDKDIKCPGCGTTITIKAGKVFTSRGWCKVELKKPKAKKRKSPEKSNA